MGKSFPNLHVSVSLQIFNVKFVIRGAKMLRLQNEVNKMILTKGSTSVRRPEVAETLRCLFGKGATFCVPGDK